MLQMKAWHVAAVIGGIWGAWLVVSRVRRVRGDAAVDIDESSSESFPASDPPAQTVLSGATIR